MVISYYTNIIEVIIIYYTNIILVIILIKYNTNIKYYTNKLYGLSIFTWY